MPSDRASSRSLRDRLHLATGFTPLFWVAVGACSLLSLGMLFARMAATHQAGHASLLWDIFLAWLPIVPAVMIHRMCRRPTFKRWALATLGLFWLLFFPNSPYLITQLIHLQEGHGPSRNPLPQWALQWLPDIGRRLPPDWFDLLLLTSVAACGLLLTFTSLQLVGGAITRRAGRPMSVALLFWIVVLASFGVALGRFARLNSWEVFTQPLETAARITEWIFEPRIAILTLVFAVLITLVYVAVIQAGKAEPEER